MFYIENIQILTIEVDILVIPTTSFVKKWFDVRYVSPKLELEKDHLTIEYSQYNKKTILHLKENSIYLLRGS